MERSQSTAQDAKSTSSKTTIFEKLSSEPRGDLTTQEMQALAEFLLERYTSEDLDHLGLNERSKAQKYAEDFCSFFKEISTNGELRKDLPQNLL